MKVIVTGHDGYIGTVLVPLFVAAGHEVVGIDTKLFEGCTFGAEGLGARPADPQGHPRRRGVDDLEGVDAVVHLAGISNDPLGDLNPECTVRHQPPRHRRTSAAVAKAGRRAAASCTRRRAACTAPTATRTIDESADFHPVTPYGESKVRREHRPRRPGRRRLLARRTCATPPPTACRPRLRGDLVVNNLTGFAFTTGEVFMKSDGTPWRPLVHIEDIAQAFLLASSRHRGTSSTTRPSTSARPRRTTRSATSPRSSQDVVRGSRITLADARRARPAQLPGELRQDRRRPRASVATGRCATASRSCTPPTGSSGLDLLDLEGNRYMRIRRVKELIESGALDHDLRWLDERAEVPA